jgi:hypothetical protein
MTAAWIHLILVPSGCRSGGSGSAHKCAGQQQRSSSAADTAQAADRCMSAARQTQRSPAAAPCRHAAAQLSSAAVRQLTGPEATALTRMPWGASCSASERVKPTMAALVEAYSRSVLEP